MRVVVKREVEVTEGRVSGEDPLGRFSLLHCMHVISSIAFKPVDFSLLFSTDGNPERIKDDYNYS